MFRNPAPTGGLPWFYTNAIFATPRKYPRTPRTKEIGMPQVNFRTSSERLAVIDRAAAIRGVSRTEFVLRSSEAAAI